MDGWGARLLEWSSSGLVFKVLLSLGAGVITFNVYTTAVSTLRTTIESTYNGLPSNILTFAHILGLDQMIAALLTAVITRAAFDFLPKFGRNPT